MGTDGLPGPAVSNVRYSPEIEGEEGECQFSFCCLGQHSQDVLSPAPAGGQEAFEGIMK